MTRTAQGGAARFVQILCGPVAMRNLRTLGMLTNLFLIFFYSILKIGYETVFIYYYNLIKNKRKFYHTSDYPFLKFCNIALLLLTTNNVKSSDL